MKKLKKKKNPKFNYIQSWGSYAYDSLISVGTSYENILKYGKRCCLQKDNIKELLDNEEKLKSLMASAEALSYTLPHGNLLWFKKFEDRWGFYELLVHELYHAITVFGKQYNMPDEQEALAYQQGFLFKEIRRKIYNHFKNGQ